MKNESPALLVHIAITCLIGTLVGWISYGVFFKKADTSKRELEENQSIITKQINDLKNQLTQLGINKDNVDKIAKEKEDLLNKVKGNLDVAKTKAGGLKTDYEFAKAKATNLSNDAVNSIANYQNLIADFQMRGGETTITLGFFMECDLGGITVSYNQIYTQIYNTHPLYYKAAFIVFGDHATKHLANLKFTQFNAYWTIAKEACDKLGEFKKSEIVKNARDLWKNAQNLAEETKISLSNAQRELDSAKINIEDIKGKLTNEEGKLNILLASLPKIEHWKESVINVVNYLEIPNLLFSLSLFIVSLIRTFVVFGWFSKCSV